MKSTWIVATVILGLLTLGAASFLVPSKPAIHAGLDGARMRLMLEMLYYRGFDGAVLFLEVPGSKAFLQIRKEIRSPGRVILKSEFPLVPWTRDYYPRVAAYLDSVGIPHVDSLRASSTEYEGPAPERALMIELGNDLQTAERYIDHVSRHILAIDPARQLEATFQNVSPRDVKIGFK